jgi:hypothetical protein
MLRAEAVIFFAALAAPACSLLVQFVDAPDAGDAQADVAVDAAKDVGVDASAYDASKVCTGLGDGWYCGYNGLNGTPPPSWLVECDAGHPFVIRVCDAGCLAFPSGTSDRCNECPGMPNGTYCGSQFPTYAVDNAAYLISCGQGIAAIQQLCTNGCQAGPGNAACK